MVSANPLVALSVGNAPAQIEGGYGQEHLAEALVRVARLLLRRGCDLAYGGRQSFGFTEVLLQLVRAETGSLDVGAREVRRSRERRRLVSYVRWPQHGDLTPDHHARRLGVCRFVLVPPPALPKPPADASDAALGLLQDGLSLSAMRRAMTYGDIRDVDGKKVPRTAARLVLGGKVDGFSGLMPGIAEEVAWALKESSSHPVAVFVLGGFGGAAAALADGFRSRTLPAELDLDRHRAGDETLRDALEVLDGRTFRQTRDTYHPEHRYRALQDACAQGVAGLSRGNGLRDEDNERLLATTDLAEVLRVISRSPVLDRPA